MKQERTRSDELFLRATKVVPGGIYGHVAPAGGLPDFFPHYAASGKGCRFQDVDGKDWLDFLCGYGSSLLGYADPEVDEAAERQRRDGAVLNQPTERMVELAEVLTDRIDFAQWAVFAKNGSDVTTWATRVAREHTGRSLVVKVKGAYHGVDAWCDAGFGGRIPEDRSAIREFVWNDLDALSNLVEQEGVDIAAIILTPYHHAAFGPSEMPSEGFWSGVEELCREHGIVLILDDVRAGFRLHDGGSHRMFGFTPDLSCYSKALGNGFAISSCAGREEFRRAARDVFLTGSCWNDAVSMAAALKCLQIAKERKVVKEMDRLGRLFGDGLETQSREVGIPLVVTGPSAMPFPWFEEDENLYLLQRFCGLSAENGLFLHPHHNWFLCGAHGDGEIEEALAITGPALVAMAEDAD
ncbi:MAG: aminotransferase class III-fold pyridoxal phosphate-dependent enzyme [Opitutales bacterium]